MVHLKYNTGQLSLKLTQPYLCDKHISSITNSDVNHNSGETGKFSVDDTYARCSHMDKWLYNFYEFKDVK